jgi:hypothetical protein
VRQQNGEGAIQEQDSRQMAREPFHNETVSGQRIVKESSHDDTGSVQQIVKILVLTSDRACREAANPWVDLWADERRDLRRRATECMVCGPATTMIVTECWCNWVVRCESGTGFDWHQGYEPEEVNV